MPIHLFNGLVAVFASLVACINLIFYFNTNNKRWLVWCFFLTISALTNWFFALM